MNIANRLTEQAQKHPHKKAVTFPVKRGAQGRYIYESLTFAELETRTNAFSCGFRQIGLKKGDRTLMFIRPSLDFAAVTFALFKLGVVPVFIDPGMGKKNLLRAIEQVKPIGLIAVPEVHLLKSVYRKVFKSVKYFITTGKMCWKKELISLHQLRHTPVIDQQTRITTVHPQETAAILFTSGGTGIPKGVVYTHQIFSDQTTILQDIYQLSEKDVDIPGFPLFALFTVAMGINSCIPDMNPSKPAKANPKNLVDNITDNHATFVAGSPAIWERVADYCLKNNLTLPTVKSLVMFGAPISVALHEKFKPILTNGTTYTPYGATECLPVANVSGRYILENTSRATDQGQGTCLGKPVPTVEVKIIKTCDEPITNFKEARELPQGALGEIIVSSSVATKEYFQMPEKNKGAKIFDNPAGRFWHRMGDIGYLDDQGRLWFGGRLTHRVVTAEETLSSVQCEAIFNQHPQVKRTALIGLGPYGRQKPALVVEMQSGKIPKGPEKEIISQELMHLGRKYPHTRSLQDFFFHPGFPVDVRHNIKIDRLRLRDEVQAKHF